MIQEAVERMLPYAENYGVRIHIDFRVKSMEYIISFQCGNLVSDIIIADSDLYQHKYPEQYLDYILKDGIDLIYQAWRSVK